MKRLAWLCVIILTFIHVGLFIHEFQPAGSMFGPGGIQMKGLDLIMRRNEAVCVLKGINPYDLWSKKVVLKPYASFGREPAPGCNEPIHVYTPWEYALAIPYACMHKQAAWIAHCVLMVTALLLIVFVLGRFGGPLSAIAALLFLIPANVDLNVGNYSLVMTAATVLLLRALDCRRPLVAGVFLALALIKPQSSVLLAVPLLLRRQWATGFVAGGLCLALTLPSAILCNTSPLSLILQAPAAGSPSFEGCALLPMPLYAAIKPYLSNGICMLLTMGMGLVAVIVLTIRLRASRSWMVLAAPALLGSIAWTYMQPHSYVLTMPVAAVLAVDIVRKRTLGRFLIGIPAILILARFVRGAEIVVGALIPSLLPTVNFACQISGTLGCVLTVVYFWRYTDSLMAIGPVGTEQ